MLNPDLFANRVVPLKEAQEKDWVTYKGPQLDPEVFQTRVKKIREQNHQELFTSLAEGEFDMSLIEEIDQELEADVPSKQFTS